MRKTLVAKQKEYNEQIRRDLHEKIRSHEMSTNSVLRDEVKRGIEKRKLEADFRRTRQHNQMTNDVLRAARERDRAEREGSDLQLDRSLASADLHEEPRAYGTVDDAGQAKSARRG